MKNRMDSPRLVALKDINDYLRIKYNKSKHETINTINNTDLDIRIVTALYLDTIETRKLNRELNIHSVNMGKHNMNRK